MHAHGVSSVVILVIDLIRVFLDKGESHAPVAADFDRPRSLSVALKGVKTKAGKAHVARGGRGIQLCQNQAQAFGILRLDARFGTCLKEPGQALVLESADHASV